MSDTILECVEIEPAVTASHSVIWLHGLGADGHDFEPIARELALPPAAHVRFIFPHAPLRPITLNGGYVMRGWYDIAGLQAPMRHDHAGLNASELAIGNLIRREIERGISARNIVLAGFSQGGAVALQTALRYPEPLAGIIALSTYLPCESDPTWSIAPANQTTPILLAHGVMDNIIALPLAERALQYLRRHGCQVDWRTYPMAHSVCLDEIAAIGGFLHRCLDGE